jgi:hypothetical protein
MPGPDLAESLLLASSIAGPERPGRLDHALASVATVLRGYLVPVRSAVGLQGEPVGHAGEIVGGCALGAFGGGQLSEFSR